MVVWLVIRDPKDNVDVRVYILSWKEGEKILYIEEEHDLIQKALQCTRP